MPHRLSGNAKPIRRLTIILNTTLKQEGDAGKKEFCINRHDLISLLCTDGRALLLRRSEEGEDEEGERMSEVQDGRTDRQKERERQCVFGSSVPMASCGSVQPSRSAIACSSFSFACWRRPSSLKILSFNHW